MFDRTSGLSSNADDAVTFTELRRVFEFLGSNSMPVVETAVYPNGVFMVVTIQDICTFVQQFRYLSRADFHLFCHHHGLQTGRNERRALLFEKLISHQSCSCQAHDYVFRMLGRSRENVTLPTLPNTAPSATNLRSRRANERAELEEEQDDAECIVDDGREQTVSDYPFPVFCSWEEKVQIIRNWQDQIERETERTLVCAVCAWEVSAMDIQRVAPSRVKRQIWVLVASTHTQSSSLEQRRRGNSGCRLEVVR